jgi:ribosomal-protein-alanine N-acetyltransferase
VFPCHDRNLRRRQLRSSEFRQRLGKVPLDAHPPYPSRSRAILLDVPDAALRAFQECDLRLLDRLESEPDALGQFEWAGYGQVGRLRKRWHDDGLISETSGHLAVSVEDATVGIATWRDVPRGGPTGVCLEIGVALLPEHRSKGIGRDAHRLLVEYLFGYTRAERLEALTDAENLAEQRVLESEGFQREALFRHAVWQRGGAPCPRHRQNGRCLPVHSTQLGASTSTGRAGRPSCSAVSRDRRRNANAAVTREPAVRPPIHSRPRPLPMR